MDLLIICKWMCDFTNQESKAPSVISLMINMALNGGEVPPGTESVIGTNGFS